ncbi:MAG: hypothetical protein DRP96_04940 [Candidatus Neomarinimicrobiota bacterium]|nr:MAG: hypothetical protein DRP96_04940 [Candidatus Neomarinimicrobiota bacterium]
MKSGSLIALLLAMVYLSGCHSTTSVQKITITEYKSKMKAAWLGQMAGVGWGAPTEFHYKGSIIPVKDVPEWKPEMINQQWQDDIYVEMTFLKTLEDYGFDVSIRQAGIDFANSRYGLAHANECGRNNLRRGIAPPCSGHPKYNKHADDIDYQIEADFSGIISPGMPQLVIELADKFGRLMNYGDGVYGGQFVGAMYAQAFFETDIHKIIEAGLRCIPAESQYAETIRDVINWHRNYPDNWQKTWQLIENKYNLNPAYRRFSCPRSVSEGENIDAKINGAYIVMGLLYGNGNMDSTIVIAMRCGQDSDCNPSNAAGILATSLGMENLPERYKVGIDDSTNFSYTSYNLPSLQDVCVMLARKAVLRSGGSIEENAEGVEEFVIPYKEPVVSPVVQSWEPEEITSDVDFTAAEMDKITFKIRRPEDLVNVWQVAGPFSQKGVGGLDLFNVPFGPETDSNYSEWTKMPVDVDDFDAGCVNLLKLFNTENSVAYLKTNVWIDSAQKVILEIGSDDGVKVWINHQLVHQNDQERGLEQGQDLAEADFKKGWNLILMKITQGEGEWGASLSISDLHRKLIDGLTYK